MSFYKNKPDWATDLTVHKSPTPLMQIALAEMSDEEFVDRIGSEIWKAPIYGKTAAGNWRVGRPGVSKAKVRQYMALYGKHFDRAKSQEIKNLLYDRAARQYQEQSHRWAIEVWDKSRGLIYDIDSSLSCVPDGCKNKVRETLEKAIGRKFTEIRDVLEDSSYWQS